MSDTEVRRASAHAKGSELWRLYRERDAARAELSRLRGVVEAVQALADEWDANGVAARASAEARQGLSDERDLRIHAGKMRLRAQELRAALAPVSSSGEAESGGEVVHPEDFCQRCGGRNVKPWFAPSDVWNAVVGGEWSIICPQCFVELAEATEEYAQEAWELRPTIRYPVASVGSSGEARHTRTSTGGFGPDYCAECSEAAQEWVKWPCPASSGEAERAAVIDAAHLSRQREWSARTFGPGSRLRGVLDHIRKELAEVEANPTDVEEWVDVLILAFDGAWRAGWEPQQIIDAIVAKQTKNECRTWPDWRGRSEDEAIEHVRSSGEAESGEAHPQFSAFRERVLADPEARTAYDEAMARDAAPVSSGGQADGAALIAAERRRQIEAEGWTPEHDAEHGWGELHRAAWAYERDDGTLWPWNHESWKPKDPLSNLIRAGALYAAAAGLPGSGAYAEDGVERCAERIDALLSKARTVLAARPVLSREALRDPIAQALHAWDVEGGPCEEPWDGLTDRQREVWLSGADAVLVVLAGGEQA